MKEEKLVGYEEVTGELMNRLAAWYCPPIVEPREPRLHKGMVCMKETNFQQMNALWIEK